jgi:hypothetical protein
MRKILGGLILFTGIISMLIIGIAGHGLDRSCITWMTAEIVGGFTLILTGLLNIGPLETILLFFGGYFIPLGFGWGIMDGMQNWDYIFLIGTASLLAGNYLSLRKCLEERFGDVIWLRIGKVISIAISVFIIGLLAYSFVWYLLPALIAGSLVLFLIFSIISATISVFWLVWLINILKSIFILR